MKQKNFRPRNLINTEIAGICGVARLADKARAAHAGEIGSYKYGPDSEQDTAILRFLGISAKTFQEAAVRIPNDIRLSVWVLDNCKESPENIAMFNRKLKAWWNSKMRPDAYSKRLRQLKREEARRRDSWFHSSNWSLFE